MISINSKKISLYFFILIGQCINYSIADETELLDDKNLTSTTTPSNLFTEISSLLEKDEQPSQFSSSNTQMTPLIKFMDHISDLQQFTKQRSGPFPSSSMLASAPSASLPHTPTTIFTHEKDVVDSSRHVVDSKYDFQEDGSFRYAKYYNDGTNEIRKGYFQDKNGMKVFIIEGDYSKILPNGQIFSVKFTSDEKGYSIHTKKEAQIDLRLLPINSARFRS